MRHHMSLDRWLGLCFLAFALILIFVWVPLDTDTGLVEKVRRRLTVGDALGPTVAGVVISLGGILTLLRPSAASTQGRGRDHLMWVASLLVLFALSLTIMRYAGPLAALGTESGYRPLRNTLPWKYIGFVLGGTAMITGMIALVQRRFSFRALALGLVASLALALLYDLPFEDLLLPPNGDV